METSNNQVFIETFVSRTCIGGTILSFEVAPERLLIGYSILFTFDLVVGKLASRSLVRRIRRLKLDLLNADWQMCRIKTSSEQKGQPSIQMTQPENQKEKMSSHSVRHGSQEIGLASPETKSNAFSVDSSMRHSSAQTQPIPPETSPWGKNVVFRTTDSSVTRKFSILSPLDMQEDSFFSSDNVDRCYLYIAAMAAVGAALFIQVDLTHKQNLA